MCGRTACTLDSIDIRKACTYVTSSGETKVPEWQASHGVYAPLYNLGPTHYSPVLVSKRQLDPICDPEDRIILSMEWGIKNRMRTDPPSKRIINARHETVLEKPTFKKPLDAGRRCVVLADGYFEWYRRETHGKLPYLIHFPQPNGIKFYDLSWKDLLKKDSPEWNGPRLLTMAGMYEIITPPPPETELNYRYTIITIGASSVVSHIHDRMPAILDGEDEIRDWLDFGRVSSEQAVAQLKSSTNVEFYRVSPIVNKCRNNLEACILPFVETPNASKNFMENWLQKGKKPTEEPATKKLKTEPQN